MKVGGFHVVVVQERQRNKQKSVMHVQSCLLNKTIAFLTLSLPSPLRLLKLPKISVKTWKNELQE